jgi:hypothetical protein
VDGNVPNARKNIVDLTKKAEFGGVNLDDVEELLNSHKGELSTEDQVQLKKEYLEEEEGTAEVVGVHTLKSISVAEAFRRVQKYLAYLRRR